MIRCYANEPRLSGAVRHGGLVYLAGQVADDTSLDAEGQTRDILAQIDHLLAETGSEKPHLLSVQIFLADITDIDAMNKAWDAWIDVGCKPARATVEARLAAPSWRVEITAIAACRPDARDA
ncbi:MAG: RidA family protein [Acetobacteraceae bacterium]